MARDTKDNFHVIKFKFKMYDAENGSTFKSMLEVV